MVEAPEGREGDVRAGGGGVIAKIVKFSQKGAAVQLGRAFFYGEKRPPVEYESGLFYIGIGQRMWTLLPALLLFLGCRMLAVVGCIFALHIIHNPRLSGAFC